MGMEEGACCTYPSSLISCSDPLHASGIPPCGLGVPLIRQAVSLCALVVTRRGLAILFSGRGVPPCGLGNLYALAFGIESSTYSFRLVILTTINLSVRVHKRGLLANSASVPLCMLQSINCFWMVLYMDLLVSIVGSIDVC